VYDWIMRIGIAVTVNAEDRLALDTLVESRNTLAKVVWRARIILATPYGCVALTALHAPEADAGQDAPSRQAAAGGGATHWSARPMAAAMGINHTSMQKICAEAELKPRLVKKFKISSDPKFEEKVVYVVGPAGPGAGAVCR
jgi:hypothetical protein